MRKMVIALIILVVLGIGGGIIWANEFLRVDVETYIAPEIVEKIIEKEVNPRDEKIRQREMELTKKYDQIKSLEARLDVLKADREAISNEIEAVQSELAGFMIGTQ